MHKECASLVSKGRWEWDGGEEIRYRIEYKTKYLRNSQWRNQIMPVTWKYKKHLRHKQ
jgi:hypothetical protein